MALFVAKHRQGIDARGADCGYQAGREGHKDKHHGYGQKRYQVTGTYSVDHAADNASQAQRCDQADGDAGQCGLHALQDYQASHIVQRGPESNAQADLSHAAFYRISQNAVDSDRAQHQGEQTEDRQQLHVEAVLRQGLTDKVFERHDIVYGYVFVHVVDSPSHRSGESLRRSAGADGEEKRVGTPGTVRGAGGLCNRIIERRDTRGAVQTILLHIAHDSDDFAIFIGEK